MDKYTVIRTDTADALIHNIILDIAEKFGADVALDKLDELEKQIMLLADNPYMGTDPRYMILRRQGYKILITEKIWCFIRLIKFKKYLLCMQWLSRDRII